MPENAKTPEIRFVGFTDAWEQRELGDVADIVGGGTPSTQIKEYWGGDIDWYAPAEIGEQIYLTSSQKKITELGLQNSSAKMLPVGTVLFTSRAGIGNTAILAKTAATNQGFQSIVPRKFALDSYFIFSRTHELKRYGETVGAGSTFVEVSGKQMVAMPILIPEVAEQKRIGQLFANLDRLITLHQRGYDKTVNIKKAMLEKMFPKEGADKPEIRFAGFTDAWEKRKLGELAQSFEYGLNAAAREYDGENKYLRITDIDDETHEFNSDALTTPDVNLSKAENYKLQESDVLFARTGASVGKTYRYKAFDGLVYFAGFLIRARIMPEYDSEFVYQNTLTSRYARYIAVMSQRSGQPGVNAQEYSEFTIAVPDFLEQRKLGAFFSNLDNLIALHRRELEKLHNMKRALLDKMFV